MRIEIEKADVERIVAEHPGICAVEIVEQFYPQYADRCYTRDAARAKVIKFLTYFHKHKEMFKIWENGKLRWYIEC